MREQSSLELYERYRPQIKSGDVIAFSGNEGFSQLIKWATGSMFSHVGIVLNTNLSGGLGRSVLIVESTVETRVLDATNSQVIKGIQLHWLSKRVLSYNGAVWWVSQKQPLPKEGLEKMQSWLRQTHNQRVPYDYVQVMGAGLDMFERLGIVNGASLSTLFCSELVTKALQIAGVVDPALNPSEQTPSDVVEFSCFQAGLPLKSF